MAQAKDVFRKMLATGRTARQVIEAENLAQVSDESELRELIVRILADHSDDVKRYHAGKKNLRGFFMGEAMKITRGRANPQLLNRLLDELLNQP